MVYWSIDVFGHPAPAPYIALLISFLAGACGKQHSDSNLAEQSCQSDVERGPYGCGGPRGHSGVLRHQEPTDQVRVKLMLVTVST